MDEPIIVKVPLDQILVVPEDNPRGPYPQQAVLDMAATLKAGGQQMPILLRLRSAEERAKAHPDKPYKLVEGYLRTAGVPLAGLTALDAIIRPMEPKEERRAAILANVRKDMHWLAWGEAGEDLMADDPDLTQQQVADMIKVERTWLTKTLKLLKVLNQASRGLICANCTNPGDYPLPEACVRQLGDLTSGSQDDQILIEKALRVVLDRKMTLEQVKKLIAWVKAGHNPEDFQLKTPKETLEDPFKSYWSHLGPAFKVKYKGEEDYEVHFNAKGHQAAWNAARSASQALQGSSGVNDLPLPAPVNPTSRLQPLIQTRPLPRLKQVLAWLKPILAGIAQRYSRKIRRAVIGALVLGGLWLLVPVLLRVFVGQPSMPIMTHPPALRPVLRSFSEGGSLTASPSKPDLSTETSVKVEGRSGVATPGAGGPAVGAVTPFNSPTPSSDLSAI